MNKTEQKRAAFHASIYRPVENDLHAQFPQWAEYVSAYASFDQESNHVSIKITVKALEEKLAGIDHEVLKSRALEVWNTLNLNYTVSVIVVNEVIQYGYSSMSDFM